MTDDTSPRFLIRADSGEEILVASVSELEERVRAGEIRPGDQLYDAGTGIWAPAWDVTLYRFIVDELERDGELPALLREALSEEVDEEGRLKVGDDSPVDVADEFDAGDEVEVADQDDPRDALVIDAEPLAPMRSEPDEEEDPLDFELELVDTDPFGAPSDPTEAEEPRSRGDADGDREDLPAPSPPADGGESDELEDFELRLGSSMEFSWDDLDPGATPETGESEATAQEAHDPSREPAAEASRKDRHGEDEEEDEEEDWFTPHAEGGMVLPDLQRADGEADAEAETWTPDEDDSRPARRAPLIQRTPYRPRAWVVGLLVLVVGVAAWLALLPDQPDPRFEGDDAAAETVPRPDLPPPPAGLEDESDEVLALIGAAFEVVSDSLREEIGLERAPPRTWLSGFYLANAGQFPRIEEFWERYVVFLEELGARDEAVYLGAVADALGTLDPLDDGERERLQEYFQVRYEQQRDYREARYEHLAATARAAVQLHEVLEEHQSEIAYSPAVGTGVSADPILEAVIPEGHVRRDVEGALDRVFRALDRSRGGGAPSAEGLQAELFQRFGEG